MVERFFVHDEDLVAGREYYAELTDCCIDGQVQLGAFKYTSGEGFVYFENGSFCVTNCVAFFEAE